MGAKLFETCALFKPDSASWALGIRSRWPSAQMLKRVGGAVFNIVSLLGGLTLHAAEVRGQHCSVSFPF